MRWLIVLMIVVPLLAHANDKICLANTIYYEARGEGTSGMIAVGQVVLNRVADDRFPDTICGVVYQPHQFSWVDVSDTKRKKNAKAWKLSLEIARMLLHPDKYWFYNTGATNYVNKRLHGKLRWTREYKMVEKVGNHYFYVWN